MLDPGTTLGPYRIERELGRGGMGIVFLARDTRLDRAVAIKALPDHLTNDPDRLARFEREAKTLATLNHPNIAAIYGLEVLDGNRFLILEYVDGPTLADRIETGAVPLDDALDIAEQIAMGLEAAHDAGIVHRDLKPGNIKIAPNGKVKILDFGLAKSSASSPSSSVAHTVQTQSPTVSVHPVHSPTIPGAIMGTAPYMSPEQARGKAVDKRSDIWSFGVVLYEMLTGTNPFHGETATDSIGAILHRDVDLSALPRETPPSIRHVIARCLQRDKSLRYHDIADAALDLRAKLEAPASTPGHRLLHTQPIAMAIVLFAMGLGLGRLIFERPSHPTIAAPGGAGPLVLTKVTDASGLKQWPALSPDGSTVYYVRDTNGTNAILSQRVGGFNTTAMTQDASGGSRMPAVSPDGQNIVFQSDRDGGGLFLMGATGESPRRITNEGFDPEWDAGGRSIVYATEGVFDPLSRNTISCLKRYSLDTNATTTLFKGDAVEPACSPNGRWVAYWRIGQGGVRDLFIISATGGDPIQITDDPATDWNPTWSNDGRFLMFLSDRSGTGDVWRIPIDDATGHPTGPAEPVTTGANPTAFALARTTGRLVYTAGHELQSFRRLDLDPKTYEPIGTPRTIMETTTGFSYGAISPDCSRIAYAAVVGTSEDIFSARIDGSDRRRLTDDAYKDRGPIWMKDGKSLLFFSDRSGVYNLWSIDADGAHLQLFRNGACPGVMQAISTDNKLLVAGTREEGVLNLYHVDRDPPQVEPLTEAAPGKSMNWAAWGPNPDVLYIGNSNANDPVQIAILNVRTHEMTPLLDIANCESFRVMPDAKRLAAVIDGKKIVLIDPEVPGQRELWTETDGAIDPESFDIASDGSWILFGVRKLDADIWVGDAAPVRGDTAAK